MSYKLKIGASIVNFDEPSDLFVYGLNGTGKTRTLKVIEKFYTTGIQKDDLDSDMILEENGKDVFSTIQNIDSSETYIHFIKSLESVDKYLELLDELSNSKFKFDFSPKKRRLISKLYDYTDRMMGEDVKKFPDRYFVDLESIFTEFDEELLSHIGFHNIYTKELFKYYRNYENEKANIDEIKSVGFKENTCALYTNRDDVIIDEIINKIKLDVLNCIDYNDIEEIVYNSNEVKKKIMEVEYNVSCLNSELYHYIDSKYRFKIDYNTWNWHIVDSSKEDNAKFSFDFFSSGEKHIIIMLVSLALTLDKIVIIDEPEISFSINYEEKFMGSIKRLQKENTRLIIASHSYNIYEKFEDHERVEILK